MRSFIKKAAALLGAAVIASAGTLPRAAAFSAPGYDGASATAEASGKSEYEKPKLEDRFMKFTEDTVFPKTSYIVSGEVTLGKKGGRYCIPQSFTVYVRSGSRLTISNGALLQVDGRLVVEKGGTVEIRKKSFLTLHGKTDNFGTVTVKKNGRLNINGEYSSNGAAVLKANGVVSFGERYYDPERSAELSEIKKRILKYDKNFSLDNYCLCRENNDIYLYYRVGGIVTDHCYRVELGSRELDAGGYPLEKVYDKELADRLRKAADSFRETSARYKGFASDGNYIALDFGFCFSYESGILSFYNKKASYFEAEGINGTFTEVEEEQEEIEY